MGRLLYFYNDKLEVRPSPHPCPFPILLSLGRAAIVVIYSSSACHAVPSEELVTAVATYCSELSCSPLCVSRSYEGGSDGVGSHHQVGQSPPSGQPSSGIFWVVFPKVPRTLL